MSVLRIGPAIGIGLERRAVFLFRNTRTWYGMIYCHEIQEISGEKYVSEYSCTTKS